MCAKNLIWYYSSFLPSHTQRRTNWILGCLGQVQQQAMRLRDSCWKVENIWTFMPKPPPKHTMERNRGAQTRRSVPYQENNVFAGDASLTTGLVGIGHPAELLLLFWLLSHLLFLEESQLDTFMWSFWTRLWCVVHHSLIKLAQRCLLSTVRSCDNCFQAEGWGRWWSMWLLHLRAMRRALVHLFSFVRQKLLPPCWDEVLVQWERKKKCCTT